MLENNHSSENIEDEEDEETPQKRYSILYVDDEDGNLRIFQRAFKKTFDVYIALSGNEALDILSQHSIHLLISDQRMPNMSGVELLRLASVQYPDTIRIILTAYTDIDDIMQAVNECGIYRYLPKPWKKEEMQQTLEQALEVYKLRQEKNILISELRESNEVLEDKVKNRTATLTETNERLIAEIEERKKIENALQIAKETAEEASKAKELFLSTMSHEIRTPLNAIIGLTYLLQHSSLNAEQLENVQTLQFSGKTLLALINDILDFSKINAGKVEFEKIDFDVRALLKSTIKTFENQANTKKIDLLLELDSSLPEVVVGDQVRLGQILNNLIGNSIKFTHVGNVKASVKLLEENEKELLLQFTISDTGIGIAENKKDLIFENFSQASQDTSRKYGGTGLGLAITKRLVEHQNGKIWVKSELGNGSVFYVVLPFAKSQLKSGELVVESEEMEVKDLKNKKILVAEDNKVNRMLVKKFLSNWQAQTYFAENGKEAVEKAQTETYDLILMDIQMPEMDGYEASRLLREMGNEVPIIALTASTMTSDREKLQQSGISDFVVKPFNPNDLYKKIARYVL